MPTGVNNVINYGTIFTRKHARMCQCFNSLALFTVSGFLAFWRKVYCFVETYRTTGKKTTLVYVTVDKIADDTSIQLNAYSKHAITGVHSRCNRERNSGGSMV